MFGKRRVFLPGEGTRLADEAGSDAIPDAAGGEGGHGVAKPQAVVHDLAVCEDEYLSRNVWIDRRIR